MTGSKEVQTLRYSFVKYRQPLDVSSDLLTVAQLNIQLQLASCADWKKNKSMCKVGCMKGHYHSGLLRVLKTYIQTCGPAHTHKERERQTARQNDRQTDRHAGTYNHPNVRIYNLNHLTRTYKSTLTFVHVTGEGRASADQEREKERRRGNSRV